ncbi:MAG: hypothetical protein ACREVX_01415 [Clostridium sp.]|uniref:hypothetical protein n=1 Tax=Clostridium sp. TaxID=1506 RepID=UPI003D6CABDE
MGNLVCEKCGKTLSKDDIILLIKTKEQQVIDVTTCHRGKCHDELEKEKRLEGYSCGFYEMNKGIKDLVLNNEFSLSLYKPEALIKYKLILQSL